MNIIFLTISRLENIEVSGIYSDLMRKFRNEGHNVFIVYPLERKFHKKTSFEVRDGVHYLGIRTLNIQKTNIIEKGVGTLLLEPLFKRAVSKYLTDIVFDLILYSTPPVTFNNVIKYLKERSPKAISYLLLKDIFPQNAVDLGLFSKKSLFYYFFRKKEEVLYKISDYIGCMSPANVNYVLANNPGIPSTKVELAPNSLELLPPKRVNSKDYIRRKYGLPSDKIIFGYGGNLGIPQGVDFIMECLDANRHRDDCFFIIVGGGTEFEKLSNWFKKHQPDNAKLLSSLPVDEYNLLIQSCDVGLIFLDHRFLIPNYPSRLLSYLGNQIPILAATDCNTDIGTIAEENGYGYWCESNSVQKFTECVDRYISNKEQIAQMGKNGWEFMKENYLVKHTYQAIVKHFN